MNNRNRMVALLSTAVLLLPTGVAFAGEQETVPEQEVQQVTVNEVTQAETELQEAQTHAEAAAQAEAQAQAERDAAARAEEEARQAYEVAANQETINWAETEAKNLETEFSNANEQAVIIEQAIPEFEEQVAETTENVSQQEAVVEENTLERDTAKEAAGKVNVEAAETNYNQAVTEKNTADENVSEAAETIENNRQLLEQAAEAEEAAKQVANNVTEESITAAKEKVEILEATVDNISVEVEALEIEVTVAKDAYNDAVTVYEEALSNSTGDVSELKEALVEAEQKKNNAEQAVADAKGKEAAAYTVVAHAEAEVNNAEEAKQVATSIESEAEEELIISENLIQELTEKVNQLQEAMGTVRDLTALGYFENRGAESAVKILTDPEITKYFSSIDLEDLNDATSIENVLRGLEYIVEANEIRVIEGLEPLKVGDTLLAAAIANADRVDDKWGHPSQWQGPGENIAQGYTGNPGTNGSPFQGWYYHEKDLFFDFVASGDYPGLSDMNLIEVSTTYPEIFPLFGHYLNIIYEPYKTTGYGLNTNKYSAAQLFSMTANGSLYAGVPGGIRTYLDGGRVLTPEEYIADIQSWVEASNSGTVNEEEYQAALAELAEAEENHSITLQKLSQARENRVAADNHLQTAYQAHYEAQRAYEETILEVEWAEEEQVEAVTSFEQSREEYETALDNQPLVQEALEKREQAETVMNTAKQALVDKTNEYVEALNNLGKAETDLEELENAEANLAKAVEARNQAEAAYNNAETILENAIAEAKEKAAVVSAAFENLEKARDTVARYITAEEVLARSESALAKAAAEKKVAEENLSSLREERANLVEKISQLEEALYDAQQRLANLIAEAELAKPWAAEELSRAETELATAEEALAAARAELEEANARVVEAQAKLEEALANLKNEEAEKIVDEKTGETLVGTDSIDTVKVSQTGKSNQVREASSVTLDAQTVPIGQETGTNGFYGENKPKEHYLPKTGSNVIELALTGILLTFLGLVVLSGTKRGRKI